MRIQSALILIVAAMLAACSDPVSTVEGAGPVPEPKRTFYVSRLSTGGDGTSWERAWNELGRINWDILEAGDRIVIDGGAEKMTYETALIVKKSGAEGAPIQIHAATEPGRDGQVVIYGGRDNALPFCQEVGFLASEGQTRELGIDLRGAKWIHLDGGRWAGIRVHAFNGPGLRASKETEHVTVRHLEVDDNGVPDWKDDSRWYPSGAGLQIAGTRLLFERIIAHDNGGDAFLATEGIDHVVIRGSWLHNRRPHPTVANEPFNLCARGNGVHVAEGGEQTGLNVEDSIVGPGFSHGLLLGDARSEQSFAVVHEVSIRNTLLISHHGESSVSNLSAMLPARTPPQRWRLENVTSVRDPSAKFTNIAAAGSGHIVESSVFVGAEQIVLQRPTATRNCQWGTTAGATIGAASQPIFVDAEFAGIGEGFADFDFTLAVESACQGVGSRITSVTGLLAQPDPSAAVPPNGNGGAPPSTGTGTGVRPATGKGPGVPPPNALPSVSFVLPVDGAEYSSGTSVALVVTASDSDGTISKVEFLEGTTSLGTSTTEPYSVSWEPPVGEHTILVRATDDRGGTAELTRRIVVR